MGRLAFIAEWVDPVSGLLWTYQLFYYPETLEVEMIDIKNRRTFLKKSRVEDLNTRLLFVGSTITIMSRMLKIVEYGDEATKQMMATETTLAMIKPDAVAHMGAIIEHIHRAGFVISKLRLNRLSKEEACEFYAEHQGRPFFEALTDFMSSGPSVAMELVAADAIRKWRDLIGPTNSETARAEAADSLRARFGTDGTRNACHGSDSPASAAAESGWFFGPRKPGRTCRGGGSSLCLLKPHTLTQGTAGAILGDLMAGFEVLAAELFCVDAAAAAEFYEVYRGVVPPAQYSGMVAELTSGPVLALEVAARGGGEPVEQLRELCGPADPEIGHLLRPHSLRAKYGQSQAQNAVHCSDLPEDGELEVNYFFTLLQRV